jgi:hypothetical protein
MPAAGLQARCKRRRLQCDEGLRPENSIALIQRWVADVMYSWTDEGWLCFSSLKP